MTDVERVARWANENYGTIPWTRLLDSQKKTWEKEAREILAELEQTPEPEDMNQTHLDLGKAVFDLGCALNKAGVPR